MLIPFLVYEQVKIWHELLQGLLKHVHEIHDYFLSLLSLKQNIHLIVSKGVSCYLALVIPTAHSHSSKIPAIVRLLSAHTFKIPLYLSSELI